MFGMGPWEIALILAIVLIIFGPGKLPQLGKSMGKTIKGFKDTVSEVEEAVSLDSDKGKKKANS